MTSNDQDKSVIKSLTYNDIMSMDPQLHNSLVYLAEDTTLSLSQLRELLNELQLFPTVSKDSIKTLKNRKMIVN